MEIKKEFTGTKAEAIQVFDAVTDGFFVKWITQKDENKFIVIIRGSEEIIKRIRKIKTLRCLLKLGKSNNNSDSKQIEELPKLILN